MLLLIDDRAGSKELAKSFNEDEVILTRLDYGDIAFQGNGPDGTVAIGIEHKRIDDVAACVKSGRFTGTQLPGMMEHYAFSILIIEGKWGMDRTKGGRGGLIKPRSNGRSIYLGLPFGAFDNWLTMISICSMLSGSPCIVKRSMNKSESVQMIIDVYRLFQKEWDQHRSFWRPDTTLLQRAEKNVPLIEYGPGDPGYPKHILRRFLFQIDGFGEDTATQLAEQFGTLENAMAATTKDWTSVPGVGKILASRAYMALHGHPDPTVKRKKK